MHLLGPLDDATVDVTLRVTNFKDAIQRPSASEGRIFACQDRGISVLMDRFCDWGFVPVPKRCHKKHPQKLWNGVEPPPRTENVHSYTTFLALMASLSW